MTDGRLVGAPELERWARDLLEGADLEPDASRTVAVSLVEASVRGVDSHGVARLPVYVARLRAGGLNRAPRPRVVREHGSMALVDGDDGPGQVAGVFAAELSASLAERHGVGAVSVRRSSHYGAAAHHVMPLARRVWLRCRLAVLCVAVVWFGYFSVRVVIEYGGQLF